ncbi:protein SCO1/2 [bacterium A37T11]|nr:protein SCO1/2 [bacterium A37T11]
MHSSSRSGQLKKIIILAAIIVLPVYLYYLLTEKGKNRYKPLPVYGEKTLSGTFHSKKGKKIPDTLYHRVAPFLLTDQRGNKVQALGDDTAITVVNFFYTRCHTFCAHMNDEVSRVAEQFLTKRSVRFYSITVDGAYDTPEVLAKYASPYYPEKKKWQFLTGQTDSLFHIARDGFLVNALQDTTGEGKFIHSSSLILLDSSHRIRGYYDVNTPKEVDRLIDEIRLLLTEEIRNSSPYHDF